MSEARIEELEDGFRRRGLPLFVEGFSASTGVFNRAAPLLWLIVALELLGALNLDWSPLGNLAAIAAAAALIAAVLATGNLLRSRRALAPPREVGRAELAGFVVVPAVLPLLFGGQWLSAVVTAAGNLALLALIYAVLGLGLVSIVGWVMRRLAVQLAASFLLLARAVPLLLIFAVVLFLTAEVWQAFGEVPIGALLTLFAGLIALGSAFLIARLPGEVRAIEREADADRDCPPLSRRQRLNVGVVLFVSQAIQVLFGAVAIGLFFIAMGLLIVDAGLMEAWTGSEGHVLVRIDFLDQNAILTTELISVSCAIACFTGLYFAIAMLTDDVYRREFLEEVNAGMRNTFTERADYVALLEARAGERVAPATGGLSPPAA